jgi:hypothetical protein
VKPMRLPAHLAVLALGVLVASGALAQTEPIDSGLHVKLKVGQKKKLNVGMAKGLMCDDGTVVQAELRPISESENELVLVGLKLGKTACRAGTANVAWSKLVYVRVTAASP